MKLARGPSSSPRFESKGWWKMIASSGGFDPRASAYGDPGVWNMRPSSDVAHRRRER
jgi:hypothetical protein